MKLLPIFILFNVIMNQDTLLNIDTDNDKATVEKISFNQLSEAVINYTRFLIQKAEWVQQVETQHCPIKEVIEPATICTQIKQGQLLIVEPLLLCQVYPEHPLCKQETAADCVANPTDRRCAPPSLCDRAENMTQPQCQEPQVDCVLNDNQNNLQCIRESICTNATYKDTEACKAQNPCSLNPSMCLTVCDSERPSAACIPFLCSRPGFSTNPICKKIEECKYVPTCDYQIWMSDDSLEGQVCCPESICGDYCRKLTQEQRLKDPKCYTPPEDKCKYAYILAQRQISQGT